VTLTLVAFEYSHGMAVKYHCIVLSGYAYMELIDIYTSLAA